MKDSKQVRSEYHSFVESYSNISALSLEEAKKAEMEKKKSYKKEEEEDDDDECTCEKVLMRKSGAFTELAERYQMSVKQFARFVESNQGLFDIETRKKAILANKFSGFKETVEWDEFFGDLELVEGNPSFTVGSGDPNKARRQQKINKAADRGVPNAGNFKSGPSLPNVAGVKLANSNELEGEELQEVTTKETASGTKYKVRVKEKDSGSSYIRYATREKIAQLRADPKIASVEMTDEGEAPEDRGEKKAQAKGGGLAVKAKKIKEKKEKEASAIAKPAKRSVTTEGLDPVGKEDADIDNDGDTDKSDEYLHKRRKAIGKAMKKRGTKKESFSNWRDELRETMGGDKEPTKLQNEKKPTGPVKNKVVINPPMGEGFDPQKVAEGLGAELVDCQEIEEGFPPVKGTLNPWEDPATGKSRIKLITDPKTGKPKEIRAPGDLKAHYETEGDQLDEIAPALAAGAAMGIGAAGLGLINNLRKQKKASESGKGSGGTLVDRLHQRKKQLEGGQ